MIEVQHLTKIFGENPRSVLPLLEAGKNRTEIKAETGHVVGVDNVNFSLNAGEIFVIMGLSGSGKSTLLRCINRLIEPTVGKVFFQGEDGEKIDVTSLNKAGLRAFRREKISMVFQKFALLPHRKVHANVAYGLEIQGRERSTHRDIAEKALEMVGLKGWGNSFPRQLSGGMQQRVGLARALATDAPILLMDEPFSALDPLIKVDMQDELLKIEKELNRTILFITHDLNEALRLGHRIAIMEAGRVVQIGQPEDIIVNPQTRYVAEFVEHADPTGVITAKTVAVPLESSLFEMTLREDDVRYFRRKGIPDVRFGIRDDGTFAGVWVEEGKPATVKKLETLEPSLEEMPAVRKLNVAISCRPDVTLRDIMRGRTYATLPTVVLDGDTFLGIVGERELMQAILEKRGATDISATPSVSKEAA